MTTWPGLAALICVIVLFFSLSLHVFPDYLLVPVLSGLISAFLLSSPRDVERYNSFTPLVDTAGILMGMIHRCQSKHTVDHLLFT